MKKVSSNMVQKEEARQKEAMISDTADEQVAPANKYFISKKVTDHLANERTFLAWVRTGLAIIAFGFVVERFGLLLREIGLKMNGQSPVNGHNSTLIGIALTMLGIVVMVVAILNFLQARRSIDKERFHPHQGFAIVLTIITCLIGIILAIYLYTAA